MAYFWCRKMSAFSIIYLSWILLNLPAIPTEMNSWDEYMHYGIHLWLMAWMKVRRDWESNSQWSIFGSITKCDSWRRIRNKKELKRTIVKAARRYIKISNWLTGINSLLKALLTFILMRSKDSSYPPSALPFSLVWTRTIYKRVQSLSLKVSSGCWQANLYLFVHFAFRRPNIRNRIVIIRNESSIFVRLRSEQLFMKYMYRK